MILSIRRWTSAGSLDSPFAGAAGSPAGGGGGTLGPDNAPFGGGGGTPLEGGMREALCGTSFELTETRR